MMPMCPPLNQSAHAQFSRDLSTVLPDLKNFQTENTKITERPPLHNGICNEQFR